MIEIKEITKTFGKVRAIDHLTVTMLAGECIALIGPNGCGKTTLIKSILGMVLPEMGMILFDGKNIKGNIQYRSDIGYMPQIGRYPENMTIGQVIEMIMEIRAEKHEYDRDLYEQFGIEKLLDKKMRTLSGGTTQKVSAVLAFLFDPKVLILDEPTAGLDPIASELLKKKIVETRSKGKLIIITSHILSELEEFVSQVVFMQDGKLVLHKSSAELRSFTGQETISKSIVHLLKSV